MKLSRREREIVKLLAETAMSHKELAWELGIAAGTMKAHMRNIGIKLQTHLNRSSISRMDIAFFALANDIADPKAVLAKYHTGEVLECSPS